MKQPKTIKNPKLYPKPAAKINAKPGDLLTLTTGGVSLTFVIGPDETGGNIPISGFKPKAPSVKVKLDKTASAAAGAKIAVYNVTSSAKEPSLEYLQWRLWNPDAQNWVEGSTWEYVPYTGASGKITIINPGENTSNKYQAALRYNKGEDGSFVFASGAPLDEFKDKSVKKSVKTSTKAFGG
jgi:hypothetical protein